VPPFKETPAPLDYVFTKQNRPTIEQKREIETRFKGLHFHSAVFSILYLAFGTRSDIMFITCKLSKACHDPGIKDYEALLWLFGYLRKYPDYAIKFYHDVTQSPVYQIAQSQMYLKQNSLDSVMQAGKTVQTLVDLLQGK
jgi:hypothetical protein